MGKQKRNWKKIIGITFVVLFIGYFITQFIVKSKLESILSDKLPETIKLTYKELHLNLLKGHIELDNVQLTSFGKTVKTPNAEVSLEHFAVSGFGYWNYLFNDVIQVDNISLKHPDVTYYHNADIPKEAYQTSDKNSFDKQIQINKVEIVDGLVKMFDSKTDSLKLQTQNIHLKLEKIVYNENTKKRKIPIDYGTYDVIFDSFFAQLGEYEDVTIQHASLTNQATKLKNLRFFTKYSKETLSKIIPYERDHYNLEVDSILIEQPQLGTVNDSILKFDSEKVDFYQPDFKVYRDKLVTDDERIKPLYSKMLRDLKFHLNLENVLIHDAYISYSEKVKADEKAGTISFSKFNADIKNVSNTYKSPTKTILNINTQFMEHSPLKVVWSFDVNNTSDLFEFQAELDALKASDLNRFMEPNLNIKLKGELEKTYFTISGNDNTSSIDFKVKFEAFDVIILKKDGNEKNKFLSDVVNIFVSKNSGSNNKSFKEASKQGIERHKTQSVFNFIWLSTKAGLFKTMTIDAKL